MPMWSVTGGSPRAGGAPAAPGPRQERDQLARCGASCHSWYSLSVLLESPGVSEKGKDPAEQGAGLLPPELV